jgi:hypothetical protein
VPRISIKKAKVPRSKIKVAKVPTPSMAARKRASRQCTFYNQPGYNI